jgi:hypothetical protein
MIQVKQIIIVGGFDDQRRGARAIIRRGMFDMARTWHRKYVPSHFRRGAERVYGYKKRGAWYSRQKSRRGKMPLMWSGQTRARARTLFHVTGSATRVRGKFVLPRYVSMKSRTTTLKGRRYELPPVGAELVRVTKREQVVLNKRRKRQVVAGLSAIRTRKVVKI